ncbi:glycosyltransferase [Bacteroides sp. 224]|uniref:glycosyltransferase n=1 Tax=Bacteroides sp. 224 TaxID=2302936 RepID=UPI0013D24D67|nr:glycosyltransferase [Bacteroides sp. 224]NDV65847.1 glycosyltransferase [Bacteroides sp. 224]
MNKTSQYQFTIIVPVYDEQDNMLRLESELSSFLKIAKMKSCVLFVNDGSKDNSGQLLQEVCMRHDDMFYISFKQNRGLSAALKAGIDYTNSEYVGYIDADLQTSPEDFNLLLEYAPEYALAMGIRAGRKDSFVKKLSSKIANSFRRMMTNDTAQDTGCPLKVIRTDYAKRIPLFTGMHRFIPALIQLQEGGTMKQIPVRHFPRIAGKSKYHLWNRLVGPFNDCFAYRWMRKRYINYSVVSTNL